ncbi:hypothetical protein EI427_23030 [Flammeovirga pectinis]|uniref:Uncharacterized protein n=1 Tax=Flammeovirga pectinis TaxID=2494373 RepID=A0A3S9PAE5_9BACT|nr:hypothetical protein [Flammeovirga pectinis]AZQ65093.1 hypothetical protein EI427_23030 [Flammeovirga pectinis]
MKPLFILIYLLFTINFCIAQYTKKTTISYIERVHANHKGNDQLNGMTEKILLAFKNGKLKGYYPKNTTKVMPFESFYFHFRGLENSNNIISNCLQEQKDFSALFSYFSDYFDLEYKVNQQEIANNIHQKPKFLQLYLSDINSPSGIEVRGPLFLIEDILTLKIRLLNKDNLIVDSSVSKIILNHQYQAEIVTIDKEHLIPTHRSTVEGTYAD